MILPEGTELPMGISLTELNHLLRNSWLWRGDNMFVTFENHRVIEIRKTKLFGRYKVAEVRNDC